MTLRPWILLIALCLAPSCGSKKDKPQPETNPSTPAQPGATPPAAPATTPGAPVAEPTPAPAPPGPALRPMGADQVSAFNYVYGNGKTSYSRVEQAIKQADWNAVKQHAEEALVKDPWHLHAHYSLASALAQLELFDAAVEHLDIALAGDWLLWGPGLASDPTLGRLLASPVGERVKALAAAYGEEYGRRVQEGLWLLGRRTRYKRPDKPGEQWSATRGELYAYDLETQRYLRITHTSERVAGWIRSPSGNEIAWVGYWQVVMPETQDAAAPPLFRRTLVGLLDAHTLLPTGQVATLRTDITRADLQYGDGDELMVSVYEPANVWTYDGATREPGQRYTLDKSAGKLKKAAAAATASQQPVLIMTMEKSWIEDPGATPFEVDDSEDGESLMVDGLEQAVPIPAGATVLSILRSPDGANTLVHTVLDACSEPPSGALYDLDMATGALQHILSGNSEFHATWLDERRFAYEDDGARIRIHDLGEGKQLDRLKNGAALSLSGLGATSGILCAE